jgi:hypothetical protein
MPIVQIWVNDENYEVLRRLKDFLQSEQEEQFEGKAYIVRSRGRFGRRRKRIKRPKINPSYIFNEALNSYWIEKEEEVVSFEKKQKRH